MRTFAWILVILGLLLIPASWVYAHYETERLDTLWHKRAMESYDVRELERQISMRERGLRPAWTVVSAWPGTYGGALIAGFGILLLAIRRPELSAKPLAAIMALALLAGCTTLPGYHGGPHPRSTQYTYPGRSENPDTGLPHSPVATVAEPTDGGVFAYGMVFHDGTTASSVERWEDFEACEAGRKGYLAVVAERVKDGAAPVMTTKCFRSHATSIGGGR